MRWLALLTIVGQLLVKLLDWLEKRSYPEAEPTLSNEQNDKLCDDPASAMAEHFGVRAEDLPNGSSPDKTRP